MLLSSLALVCLLNASAIADDELAQRLLTDGWPDNPTGKQIAAGLLQEADAEDAHPVHAYAAALTSIHHGDYLEAIEWLQMVTVADAKNLAARRACIWLLARTRQHNRALQELAELTKLLAKEAASEGEDEEGKKEPAEPRAAGEGEQEELFRFVGRMMGFYAGPASDQVASSTLDRYSREVLTAIPEAALETFNQARDEVLADFESKRRQAERSEAEARVDAVDEQKIVVAALEEQQLELQAATARIRPQLDQLRDDARQDLQRIEAKDQPLATQMNRFESRAISLDSELNLIVSDINQLEFRAAREEDPYFRERFLLEADRLRVIARRIDIDLLNAQRQFNRLANERRQLRADYTQLERQYDRGIENLVGELEKLQKAQRRTDAQLLRARRGPDVDLRRVRSLKAELNAVTTYEDFPLEAERVRLLKEIKTKDAGGA